MTTPQPTTEERIKETETFYDMKGSFLKGYNWKKTEPDGTVTEGYAKTFEDANAALFGGRKEHV